MSNPQCVACDTIPQFPTASPALQKFISKSHEFMRFLSSLHTDFALRLRYESYMPSTLCADRHVYLYIHLAQQLDAFYKLYITQKLEPSLSASPHFVDGTLHKSVNILCDFVQVVHIVYAQLLSRFDMVELALKEELEAFGIDDKADVDTLAQPMQFSLSGSELNKKNEPILLGFLQRHNLNVKDLTLMFKKEYDLILETLSLICRDLCDAAEKMEVENVVQTCRVYVKARIDAAQEESRLVQLQARLKDLPCSLAGLSLVQQGQVAVHVAPSEDCQRTLFNCKSRNAVYVFDDGLFVVSDIATDKGGSQVVRYTLRLREDVCGIEDVPDHEDPAAFDCKYHILIICESQLIRLSFPGHEAKVDWYETISVLTDTHRGSDSLNIERSIPMQATNDIASCSAQLLTGPSTKSLGPIWVRSQMSLSNENRKWTFMDVSLDDSAALVYQVIGWTPRKFMFTIHLDTDDWIIEKSESPVKKWPARILLRQSSTLQCFELATKNEFRANFYFEKFQQSIDFVRNAKFEAAIPNDSLASSISTEEAAAVVVNTLAYLSHPKTNANGIGRLHATKHKPDLEVSGWMATKKRKSGNYTSQEIVSPDSPKPHYLPPKECEDKAPHALSWGPLIQIVLTGVSATSTIRNDIDSIPNAHLETEIRKATHLIVSSHQLKRTVKFMCGISCCDHIYIAKWLEDSARKGAPINDQNKLYCLHDPEAQERWNFDLYQTMYGADKAKRRKLFAKHRIFITNHKSLQPPVEDLCKIVKCAGGSVRYKGIANATDLIVSNAKAMQTQSARKSLQHADGSRIYSPELIMSSILQQRVDLSLHRLFLPE